MASRATDRLARQVEQVGPAAADAASNGHRAGERFRVRFPARLRITGWMVLLLAVALISVAIVTRNLLLGALDREITQALQQEVEEFEQFAREGRNPETGQPFTEARVLLVVHLERQRTNEAEALAGVTPGSAPLIQGQADVSRAATEPGVLAAITARPGQAGTFNTREGELRWANVPIVLAAADAPGVEGSFVVAHLITPEQAEIDAAIRTLALVSVLGLFLAAAASWVVAGQILEPVRLVRRAVTEIGERDLTRRIPVSGHDDIATLSEQFNLMLDRLEAAFGSQRAFLDDASHELRTPITIISGTLELLSDDPVERAEEIRLCVDELDRMNRIVEELLLLAKSERPDFVQPEYVELAELTSDVYAKVRALGPRRWHLEQIGEGRVWVDPQRITQAVAQMAQNAVQHTHDGDLIELGSACRESRVVFWISDTGPGVPPEDRDVIFERFTRGSTGGALGHRVGAGLGLTIVAAIAEAHHGTVTLTSTHGHGARFDIDLPMNGAKVRS